MDGGRMARSSDLLDRYILEEESRRKWDAKYRRMAGIRLKKVAGCKTCEKSSVGGLDDGPFHDASAACRNGFDEHCSCGGCY